jgi:hypothetical protein
LGRDPKQQIEPSIRLQAEPAQSCLVREGISILNQSDSLRCVLSIEALAPQWTRRTISAEIEDRQHEVSERIVCILHLPVGRVRHSEADASQGRGWAVPLG